MDFKRWMVHRTQLYLYIEEAESGGVRLLRCYGDSPAIAVPGEINGYPVTEIWQLLLRGFREGQGGSGKTGWNKVIIRRISSAGGITGYRKKTWKSCFL